MKVWKVILWVLILVYTGCRDDDDPPGHQLTPITLKIPSHFPDMEIPADNLPVKERIDLGRKLYYDKNLAQAGGLKGLACASCHPQDKSFTTNLKTAILPHVNLGWSSYFLWNGAKEGTLEDVMVFEFADFFAADPENLKQDPVYQEMFRKAFSDGAITTEHAAMALAQFVRTLISGGSRFDRYLQGKDTLSPAELRGYEIFNSERGDCFHCHSIPLFTDNQFHNIGLVDKFKDHLGRYTVTGKTPDVGAFKTPTIRNIALTGPYMHDDRFATLQEVIEHYNSGVLPSPSLDPIMTKPGKETGLHLSPQDKADLLAFMLTLTDEEFLSRKELGAP